MKRRAIEPILSPALLEVTIFDLDRTITRRGTYSPFLLYAARATAPWRLAFVPAVLLAMIGYRAGLLRRRTLKEIMHRLLLGGATDRATVERIADGFAARTLESNVNAQALDRIAAERATGRTLILATAAHHFYADVLARRLGIRHVVATRSRWRGDMLLPGIHGENCHGREKAAALSACLAGFGVDRARLRLRFYSDDASDLSCFEMCDEPVAVNPSAALRRLARRRGWPVERFR